MTVLRKSDAQLDAEAARRNPPPASVRPTADPDASYSPMGLRPPVLDCGRLNHGIRRAADQYGTLHDQWCCLASEARYEWRMAIPDGIHVRAVPSDPETIVIDRDDEGNALRSEEAIDVGELGGLPFRPAFVAFMDYPYELILKAAKEYRERECAAKHRDWVDHRGRAVCGSLLHSVIGLGVSIERAAELYELTPERAARHLETALRNIWNRRAAQLNDLDGRRTA